MIVRRSVFRWAGSLLLMGAALFFSFCKKEFRFTDSPSDVLAFSQDTLRFDTVFAQLGSATRILKAYNRNEKEWLRVSKIALEKGSSSKFNLNVDGLPGRSFENIEIAPGDSLYIFAEVTIDPDEPLSVSPYILDENLVFETNGQQQTVILEAWGQNANYVPSRYHEDSITLFSCDFNDWVWDDPRPYVIWGAVFVDECSLRIPAGARVHFHGGIAQTIIDSQKIFYNDGILFIGPKGSIKVQGAIDRPVVFSSDRLESSFDETPGQWAGIRIGPGSKGNSFEHAIVRRGIVGIRADSASELTLRKSQFYFTSGPGLVGVNAKIRAENCLFYQNGGACVQLGEGGDYAFDHCTMAAYGVDGSALSLSGTRCNDAFCDDFDLFPLSASFTNCIFMGSRADQIDIFDKNALADFEYQFTNCIVRVRDLVDPSKLGHREEFLGRCIDCIQASLSDSLFVDDAKNDFHLDSLSIAIGKALPLPTVLDDLDDQPRDPTKPDIGCFERKN